MKNNQKFVTFCSSEVFIGFIIVTRTEKSLETRAVSDRLYCNVTFQEIIVPSPLSKSKQTKKVGGR